MPFFTDVTYGLALPQPLDPLNNQNNRHNQNKKRRFWERHFHLFLALILELIQDLSIE